MSATEVHSPSHDAAAGTVDMRLEVQIIPVSDVDRVSGDTSVRGSLSSGAERFSW